LLIWTLKASSLIWIPITWLQTLHTSKTGIKRLISWANTFSSILVKNIGRGTRLTFFSIIIPKVWIIARYTFSILFKWSFWRTYTSCFKFTEYIWWWTNHTFSSCFIPIFRSLTWNALIQRNWFIWSVWRTYTFLLIKIIFESLWARKTSFFLIIPKVWWIASNTFWSDQKCIFWANASCCWGFKNKSRRAAFASFWNSIKNSSCRTSHTLLPIPNRRKSWTGNASHLTLRIMRIGWTLLTSFCILIPVFWLETTYTLKPSIIGEFFGTLAFFHFYVELICFWASKTHSCGIIPVMRIITCYTFSIILERGRGWAFAFHSFRIINISIRTMSTRICFSIPIVWICARCTLPIL